MPKPPDADDATRSPPPGTPTPPADPFGPLQQAAGTLAHRLLARPASSADAARLVRRTARRLRRILALTASSAATGTTPRTRRLAALAIGCDALARVPGPALLVAELRLFAGLSLRECAELLGSPQSLLRSCWRPARRCLFAAARRLPHLPGAPPHPYIAPP